MSLEAEEPLITALIRILHIPEEDMLTHGIIRNAVKTLVNLTKCEYRVFGREDPRSDFALNQIVQHEMMC